MNNNGLTCGAFKSGIVIWLYFKIIFICLHFSVGIKKKSTVDESIERMAKHIMCNVLSKSLRRGVYFTGKPFSYNWHYNPCKNIGTVAWYFACEMRLKFTISAIVGTTIYVQVFLNNLCFEVIETTSYFFEIVVYKPLDVGTFFEFGQNKANNSFNFNPSLRAYKKLNMSIFKTNERTVHGVLSIPSKESILN